MLKQYVSADYFRDTYGGVFDGTDAQLDRELKFASLKIDGLTFNRIVDFNRLTEFQQDIVKLAVCFQADYGILNGNADSAENGISGYTSLDISVSLNTNKGRLKQALDEFGISTEAYNALIQTGLMRRGI